jgi:hypothetical protein
MTSNEQTAAFEAELRKTIAYFRKEFHLTLGEVVGTMNVLAIQLTMEQLSGLDAAGDYTEARDTLQATPAPQEPPMAPGGSLDDLEEPKPVLDPVYAKCEECGWPGGPFATKELAKEAHNEHALICFTPTKLWSFPQETREFIESGATLAEVTPKAPAEPPPAPMLHNYNPCPTCGWEGGGFEKQWQAVNSHRQQKSRHELENGVSVSHCRRTYTLKKD